MNLCEKCKHHENQGENTVCRYFADMSLKTLEHVCDCYGMNSCSGYELDYSDIHDFNEKPSLIDYMELEDKVKAYEKILIDILNVTYKHPQRFDHTINAYKLIPGHVKFLRNSFDTMCDKYDPVFEENAKLKEKIKQLEKDIKRKDTQLDVLRQGRINDDKRISDLNDKFWMPLCTKLYGTTKVNKGYEDVLNDICSLKDRADGQYKASIRKDELIKHLRDEKKVKDAEIERYQHLLGEKLEELHKLSDNYDELKNELDKYKESDDIYFTTTQVNAMVESMKKENGEIKALKDQIGYLERENEMIKEMNSNQFKTIEKMRSEKAKLEKELETALNKTTALLSEIHSRNEDVERLHAELVTKKKEYKDTINALKSQKKYLEERMTIMKDDIKYLKERYEEE